MMNTANNITENPTVCCTFYHAPSADGTCEFNRYATFQEVQKQIRDVLEAIDSDELDGDKYIDALALSEYAALEVGIKHNEPCKTNELLIVPGHNLLIRVLANIDGALVDIFTIKYTTGDVDFVWRVARALSNAIYAGQYQMKKEP